MAMLLWSSAIPATSPPRRLPRLLLISHYHRPSADLRLGARGHGGADPRRCPRPVEFPSAVAPTLQNDRGLAPAPAEAAAMADATSPPPRRPASLVRLLLLLVFYRGRAPHGQKFDWIMHEYRLDEPPPQDYSGSQLSKCSGTMGNAPATAPPEDGWVVCRVFKKNHHDKVLGSSPKNYSSVTSGEAKSTQALHSCADETLDQILQYLGRSCKQESDVNAINPTVLGNSTTINNNDAGSRRLRYLRPTEAAVALNGRHQAERLMKLPALEPPSLPSSTLLGDLCPTLADLHSCSSQSSLYPSDGLHALLNLEKSCLLPHDDSSAVNDWAGFWKATGRDKVIYAGCGCLGMRKMLV